MTGLLFFEIFDLFLEFGDAARQLGEVLEDGRRTVVLHAREGGVPEAHLVVGDVLVDAALRADLHAVADRNVVGDADLPGEEAVAAHARGSGNSGLRRGDGVLADLHVVSDLDQVVELHAAADDGRVGLRAVDAGVGADLHVVLDDDVAQLGDLVEASGGVGHESEAVGADDGPGVEDAAAADDAPLVDLHARIERRAVADPHAAADVYLRVDLAVAAHFGPLFDDREVADVALLAQAGTFVDRGAGADPLAAGTGGVVHLQEAQDAGRGVVDAYERGGHRLCGFERAVHEDDRGLRGVEEGFVFGVGQIAQRSGLSFLDRRDGVHLGVLVADDLSAEESGDHFGRKFHHAYYRYLVISIPSGRNSSTLRPKARTSRTVEEEMSATGAGVKSITVVMAG